MTRLREELEKEAHELTSNGFEEVSFLRGAGIALKLLREECAKRTAPFVETDYRAYLRLEDLDAIINEMLEKK